uniref:Response regulator receiver domain-containing protein n=1 Tax=Candidatus Kentrum sp. LFY TaxID=2126342 RepID=A0A450WTG7_9GAMM|nr:MAG: hypothetical protein BECKLFY1418C_GA0070996_10713 [Candidatus Kentron sp. LFY]
MPMVSRNNDRRPVILWVEDNPHSPLLRFIPEQAEKKGIGIETATGVRVLRETLHEIGDMARVKGIILDIMIRGAPDLKAFGMEQIKLGDGDEAGMSLIKHIFRKENGAFPELNDTPILVLTISPTVFKRDFEKYRKIELARKYDRASDWESIVKSWIAERAG